MTSRNQTTVLYLHGFASSPASTKATFFNGRLEGLVNSVLVPDLNGRSFRSMTISSQLEIIQSALAGVDPGDRLVVIGSSMGGLLAVLCAPGCPNLEALVLLAPGFGLPRRWTQLLGSTGVERWKENGHTEVFHHGLNRESKLDYGFLIDAERYRTDGLTVNVPTLVFHGQHDETVPISESLEFARVNCDLVDLRILDDGHELIEPLEEIWAGTIRFLIKVGILTTGDSPALDTLEQHKVS